MSGMDFHVTREAAQFATEARIHHMCAVAGLICRTCCLGGPAYTLVTNLGTEGLTEWKTVLINEATGKMPRLFGKLENSVLRGEFQPGKGALAYVLPTPKYDINRPLEDMAKLRKVLKDLRRAELIAAKEHDRIRAAAKGGVHDQAPTTSTPRAPTSEGRAEPTDSGSRVTQSQTPGHATRTTMK
jgi:hypothetical protein